MSEELKTDGGLHGEPPLPQPPTPSYKDKQRVTSKFVRVIPSACYVPNKKMPSRRDLHRLSVKANKKHFFGKPIL